MKQLKWLWRMQSLSTALSAWIYIQLRVCLLACRLCFVEAFCWHSLYSTAASTCYKCNSSRPHRNETNQGVISSRASQSENSLFDETSHGLEKAPGPNRQSSQAWLFQSTFMLSLIPLTSLGRCSPDTALPSLGAVVAATPHSTPHWLPFDISNCAKGGDSF